MSLLALTERQNPIAHGARQPSALTQGPRKDAGTTGCIPRQAPGPETNVQSRTHHFAALRSSASRSSAAERSCSMAMNVISRRSIAFSERRAQVCASSFVPIPRLLLDEPSRKAPASGASAVRGGVGRAHQEGQLFLDSLAFTFAPVQLVIQRVISLDFFMEAPMQQTEIRVLGRLDAPSVVHPHLVAMCKTYRQAVQLCWQLRRVRNMTRKTLAEAAGLYPPHVTCYLSDDAKTRRDLPGEYVKPVEWTLGNTAISQWHAMNAQLTCVEEMQAMKAGA